MARSLKIMASAILAAALSSTATAQHGAVTGATGGPITGATGGSISGAVGGSISGGTEGAVTDAARSARPRPRPILVRRQVVVGQQLPRGIRLHASGNKPYAYGYINGQRVRVDRKTRIVIEIVR